MKAHQRYEWTYLYSFVRPNTGEVYWLILPKVGVEVFSLALEHFAREVGAGTRRRVMLVLDQAGWHTGKGLKVPEGIHLEFLSRRALRSYSPQSAYGLLATKESRIVTSRRSKASKRR